MLVEGSGNDRYISGAWCSQGGSYVMSLGALADFKGVPAVAMPAGLQAEMRPYQKDGFDFLCHLSEIKLGGILAESMAVRGAQVTGIDQAEKPLKVAQLHLLESGQTSVGHQYIPE